MAGKRKTADPMWVVRGVNGGQDVTLVIEVQTAVQAECFATKRGIEVVLVGEATRDDVAIAREAALLWRYTPEPRHKCLGRPVGGLQMALLCLLGVATVALNLKAHHPSLKWLGGRTVASAPSAGRA